nr:MucR family transcriptional regulator [Methylobacterium sp. ap11]
MAIAIVYVSRNFMPRSDIDDLIAAIDRGLRSIEQRAATADPAFRKATPAQIRRSITPNGLVSFVGGKKYRTLRRHLRSHGLSFDEYRLRYGLPPNYPVACEALSALSSRRASDTDLGRAVGRNAYPKAWSGNKPVNTARDLQRQG